MGTTEDAPARPIELSRVWIGDKVIAHDVEGDDLADVLQQNGDASAWGVLPRADSGALRQMARFLDLDELTVSQLLSAEHQVRYDEAGRARLAMLRAVETGAVETGPEPAITDEPVSLIIADQLLLILANDPVGRQLAATLSRSAERLAGGGPDRAAQLVLRHILGGYATAVHGLEVASDRVSDELFGGDPLSAGRKLDVFGLRKTVTALRRATQPAGEVIDSLVESGDPDGIDERRWNALSAHHDRIASAVDALGDNLTAVYETSLSLDGAHTNEVMKKLTGWAAIIAIPALITGFVGMNVEFWFHSSVTGFYVYLALMLVSAVALYIVFKRKSWL